MTVDQELAFKLEALTLGCLLIHVCSIGLRKRVFVYLRQRPNRLSDGYRLW